MTQNAHAMNGGGRIVAVCGDAKAHADCAGLGQSAPPFMFRRDSR